LENVDIFYGHWEYLTDIWEISWPFCDSFGSFFPVVVLCTKEIWQPCSQSCHQFGQKSLGYILGAFFPQPHLATLNVSRGFFSFAQK
jgi:hypothetical protein